MPELELELTLAGADEREAAQLAALLERAAAPSRFEIPQAELEMALERARPLRRRFTLPRVAVATAAVAVVILLATLVVPGKQGSVQARALAAFGGDDTILRLREEVFTRVGGTQETTIREVWYDPSRGRARWRDISPDGNVIGETLVVPGRFDRVVFASNVHLFGRSCRTIAAGCAQVLDPVSRYREALRRSTLRPVRTTFNGRATYRFVLPLQPGLDQIAYVDTETLLPRSLVWREHGSIVSTIDVTDVERVARMDLPKGTFARPRGGRLVSVVPAGKLLSVHRLTIAQARRTASVFWLGPRDLKSIVERRYAGGTATVARYPRFDVWTYDRTVPPELLAPRFTETKTLDIGGAPVTFLSLGARIGVVRDGFPSVAVFGTTDKEELFDALRRARPLR